MLFQAFELLQAFDADGLWIIRVKTAKQNCYMLSEGLGFHSRLFTLKIINS